MLQAQREVVGWHHVADVSRSVGTYDAHGRGENNEEGHEGHQSHDFWQNEIVGRIDTHDVERIDLLGNTHRAQL